jgi:hypothetical protein
MANQDPEIEAFSKFVEAIEPWLGEVVLIGGWAHRLYRLDSRARKLEYPPLTTLHMSARFPDKGEVGGSSPPRPTILFR